MRRNWPSLACPSSNGESFWSHEWEKHGTCSESVLDQHSYFETSLSLRQQTKLLQSLKSAGNPRIQHPLNHIFKLLLLAKHIAVFILTALLEKNVDVTGINPDGGSYSLANIKDAIKEGTGKTPWIECNEDSSGNSQLYQVYLCVDSSGSNLIECPVFPKGKCGSDIEFPTF